MSFQIRGRPKSADQVLMAIRAKILEWETRITNYHPISKDTSALIAELKNCWGAGTGEVAVIWQEKVKEIDLEINLRRSMELKSAPSTES